MDDYILITGDETTMQSITDIPGLNIRARTSMQNEFGLWEVKAYASDASIQELQNRGATIETLLSGTERSDHIANLDESMNNNDIA